MGIPIYVTRVNVGKGRGMVLVSLESPSGDTANGEVQNMEAARVVMSESTFAQVTALFVDTLKKMQPTIRAASYQTNGASAIDQAPRSEAFTTAGSSTQKH
ncbi:MAG: hypothetical protein ABSA49_01260 [Rhizomicrobium sp.]|jgi:hypothetical protein